MNVNLGDIFFADLGLGVGAEQACGIRPVIILSQASWNTYVPIIHVVPVSKLISEPKFPFHVKISANSCGLDHDAVVLSEQIRSIDRLRLKDKIGRLDPNVLEQVLHEVKSILAWDGKNSPICESIRFGGSDDIDPRGDRYGQERRPKRW